MVHTEKKADVEDEAERIVIIVAKIIRNEIRDREYNSESYPTTEDIGNMEQSRKWVP